MTTPNKQMRDFGLEVFFSEWEFKARHHMTASDMESRSMADLLDMASPEDREAFHGLSLGYTETRGAPDLRAEIANTYEHMGPENVLCLAGVGEGLYAVARVLLDPGDHVAVPTPNYQSAETVPLQICEVTGVPLTRTEDDTEDCAEWRLDLNAVREVLRPNTKLVSINFPHNPTGAVLPRDDLDALVSMCRERGIWILSDEVYRGMELDPDDCAAQVADVYERGVSLNVMSKAYGLPGLRVGWIACRDRDLLTRDERYKHYLSICNSAPSERLALIALRARDRLLERNRALLAENVELARGLFYEFPGLVDFRPPRGGCVAFPRYNGPDGVEAFCRKLLEESGVLLLPSSVYASEDGETPSAHFRIDLGWDRAVKEGLEAMQAHMRVHYANFRR